MIVRPLTRRNAEGDLYRRLDAVEAQIAAALELERRARVERARISDRERADFLQAECVVYLIREAYRDGDNQVVDDLAGILIDRCAVVLAAKLRKLGPDMAAEASDEVIELLFAKIIDLDSDVSDYYQVRFWAGLESLAISAFRRYLWQVKQAADVLPLSALAGQEIEQDDSDDAVQHTAASTDYRDPVLSPEQFVLCEDALVLLPEPIRSAFALRYYANWPIESQDPDVPTLSEAFGVTPRAIRKWFEKADKILENWRGA